MDSKLLAVFFDADEVAYVNPFCKKQNINTQGNNITEALAEDTGSFDLTFSFFCNAPFQFEFFNWDSGIITEETQTYAHHTPSLPESAIERFYPPPRA
ncbi:hypothetical protein [Autumnicola psychrophila]|uniref:Uncharacterized protein n=1 Tax=Autumnicola psychrophila TaxID=3075592 RepID=A0ABU3DRY2_9FLAO|nr:hypothetical protein [Zunongwangia sp. F225]MDT0686468.1 hypothetical protein [Zunongwangia sp. F225]